MDDQKHETRNQNGTAGIPLLLNSRETCRILGISDRKRFQLTKDGVLPSSKIGTRVAYPAAGLRAWVEAGCPTEPGSAASLKWTGGAS